MTFANGAALAAVLLLAAGPGWAQSQVKVPEGTEFSIRLEDDLSSKTASQGDRFTISLSDDVKLPDGTVLKAGYRGVGEVIEARASGALGRTGRLNIRLTYLKVGDQRIRLRAVKAVQGGHNTGAQVATGVLLFPIWPVAALIKGKSTQIAKGAMITAYADRDTTLTAPVAPPPADF